MKREAELAGADGGCGEGCAAEALGGVECRDEGGGKLQCERVAGRIVMTVVRAAGAKAGAEAEAGVVGPGGSNDV